MRSVFPRAFCERIIIKLLPKVEKKRDCLSPIALTPNKYQTSKRENFIKVKRLCELKTEFRNNPAAAIKLAMTVRKKEKRDTIIIFFFPGKLGETRGKNFVQFLSFLCNCT